MYTSKDGLDKPETCSCEQKGGIGVELWIAPNHTKRCFLPKTLSLKGLRSTWSLRSTCPGYALAFYMPAAHCVILLPANQPSKHVSAVSENDDTLTRPSAGHSHAWYTLTPSSDIE